MRLIYTQNQWYARALLYVCNVFISCHLPFTQNAIYTNTFQFELFFFLFISLLLKILISVLFEFLQLIFDINKWKQLLCFPINKLIKKKNRKVFWLKGTQFACCVYVCMSAHQHSKYGINLVVIRYFMWPKHYALTASTTNIVLK